MAKTELTKDQAIGLVKVAINNGTLTRPDRCEVCNKKPISFKHKAIVGHHWQGYSKPLDVLWVCQSCNLFLIGKHDGSLSLEEIKLYVKERQRARLFFTK